MIRDSSKILFELVDDFERRKYGETADEKNEAKGDKDAEIHKPINVRFAHTKYAYYSHGDYLCVNQVSNLTDRPEWPSALLRVQFLGKDVVNVDPTVKQPAMFKIATKDPLPAHKKCTDSLKALSEFPSKVILTGAY